MLVAWIERKMVKWNIKWIQRSLYISQVYRIVHTFNFVQLKTDSMFHAILVPNFHSLWNVQSSNGILKSNKRHSSIDLNSINEIVAQFLFIFCSRANEFSVSVGLFARSLRLIVGMHSILFGYSSHTFVNLTMLFQRFFHEKSNVYTYNISDPNY